MDACYADGYYKLENRHARTGGAHSAKAFLDNRSTLSVCQKYPLARAECTHCRVQVFSYCGVLHQARVD